jgi:hypothetical protein
MKIPITQALQALNLPVKNGKFSCPNKAGHANGDAKPSAGIPSESRWHCFACGAHGDAIDLVSIARGINFAEACRFLGHKPEKNESKASKPPVEKNPAEPWPPLRLGTAAELDKLSTLRGIEAGALRLAQSWGFLRFGEHPRQGAFWAATDATRRAVEARRLDGNPWTWGDGTAKAWAFKGSRKDWPLGLQTGTPADSCSFVMLCEGPPDTLAALNLLAIAGRVDILPVAVLGAAAKLGADAVAAIAGRPVLIWAQPDRAGIEGAKRWAEPLLAAGGTVKALVPFQGGDLNDWLRTRPGRDEIRAAIPFPKKGGNL